VIQRLVALALRAPFMVLILALGLVAAGLASYSKLDIEAYPNPVPPLVEVITQPDGWSAEEVERYVTVPLEIGLSGMPGLDHVRSQSLFGLSDVKCYFRWGTKYEDARQEVINRLSFVQLPPGMQAQLSPWNAIGEIFRYKLVGRGYSARDLNTAQNWLLEREFKRVPGVIDVVSFGGETKQFHVNVDPFRLRGEGITLPQVLTALANSNLNVGGQRLTLGEQSYNVRGIGLLRGKHDIENVVVAEAKGTPIRIRDVAEVEVGHAPRLGIVGNDEEPDVVQGTVLMRYGGATAPTLEGIYKRIDEIRRNHILPPGMEIVPYYDRGALVKLTTHTVIENLLVGMGLVTIVLVIFLGHTKAALLTAVNIPLALLAAFCGMVGTGTPANLISLGAVDFGIVVDSTVIMMENIFHHLGRHGHGDITERILRAAREVGGPMTSSTLIIAVAFLPLFTMTGVSGVIFSPLALTYAFAIGGAILLALTLTPVLSSRLMEVGTEEKDSAAMRALHRLYSPLFCACLRRPKTALSLSMLPIIAAGALLPLLGGEFMPKLEEGNFWIRATFPTSISLEETAKRVSRIRDIVRGCPKDPKIPCTTENRTLPEVETVISQLGRPDDGTDVSGFFNVEIFAPLKPFDAWRRGVTKESLTDQLSKELEQEFPGVIFNFSQMISDNVEEALSGVKGENSVKIIGPDIKTNVSKAAAIVDVMDHVDGVKDLGMLSSLGQPNIKITIDRAACARYGLNTGDVDAVVQAAIGGQAVTQVYDGEKHFDLTVRWLAPYRTSISAIRAITVPAADGAQIPIGQLGTITKEDGPSIIYREDGRRYTPVKFSVRGRDLASTVNEAQRTIADKVKLPYDTHLEWAGQLGELKDAMGRLIVIVPLTLLAIGLLVYGAVRTGLDTFIVLASIPVACAGGVLLLFITRISFSVSAAMGFVSIFGIAVQDAILVVTYFQRLRAQQEMSIEQAALEAAEKRLRPVLMTTLVAMLGLLPAALATGIGSQTQKPLAVVVIGGAFMLAVLNRAAQPPMLLLLHRWQERRRPKAPPHVPPPPSPKPSLHEEGEPA
jgi:cobalt-zinc-cadmium resistance protein CzcA